MNHYDVLGLAPSATPDEVRAAHGALAQIFHPNRLTQFKPEARAFAQERLTTINQAYAVLSDPARRAAYDAELAGPYRPPRAGTAGGAAPAPPPGTPRPQRSLALERRRRLARLEAEIAEQARQLAELEAEGRRTRALWRGACARAGLYFWVGTALTGLGLGSVLWLAVFIFSQPAGRLAPLAQRAALALAAALYEYLAALAITVACRLPGGRAGPLGALRATGRGLIFGWAAGLAGWAAWAAIFGGLTGPAALAGLALVFALAHVVFCWTALGRLPRLAREQQRAFEHAYTPMLQAFEHTLAQLRAQKAALDSETA